MKILKTINDWLKTWTWKKASRVILKALKNASKEEIEKLIEKINKAQDEK